MASVTQRVAEIKQPYGGYLPMKSFKKEIFDDGLVLNEKENIHASLVGIAVDYLTRFALGDSVDKAFHVSCLGAYNIGMLNKANLLKSKVTGLDDLSIISACKLAGFDVCFRSSKSLYKPVENINPDAPTIENIRTMVNRSVSFFNKYGPIVCSKPTFEGGYTDIVNAGDGDFLSKDTLWDFKVSKSAPTTKHSLQILMYYVMGLHSIHDHFKSISYLGFYNPRLNSAYICLVTSICKKTIEDVENNVICYGASGHSHQETNQQKKAKPQPSNDFTVADICNKTGIKKSVVYADIRAGRLNAYKKGNKYCISYKDYLEYIGRIKLQQKIAIGVSVAFAIATIIIMFLMFSKF